MKPILISIICLSATSYTFAQNLSSSKSLQYYEYVDSADKCINEGRYKDSEKFILSALRTDPSCANNAMLLSNMATIQRMQHRYEEAINNYTLALNMMPKATTFLNNRGKLYLEIDSINLALKDFDKVIEYTPRDKTARFHRILVLIKQQKLAEAKRDLDDLFVIAPKSVEYEEAQARLYQARQKFSDAILCYTHLLKKDKDNIDWLISRAECFLARKNYNSALEDIADALEIDPQYGYLYLIKAKIRKLQYEYADSEKCLELAYKYGISKEAAKLFMEI